MDEQSENQSIESPETQQEANTPQTNSIQPEAGIRRKSSGGGGGFMSRLQSSHKNDGPDISNIPSSFASAISSISTFASNFNISASSNNSGNVSDLTIETASTSTKLSQSAETKEEILVKRAARERKNLISLTKLIVKDLISSSLQTNRTIEDGQDVLHLNNYFILVDRVLKHGLKQNLLSNKSANLWSALDSLPKYLKESTLMSESVRSLTNTRTPDGKIKAWMRLAMMQKKLPEYFNELLANKDALLKDIYHEYAFMLNDEAQVFAGLIIGVNVIDCNFFVKDANFDLMDDIIDLSLYLRAASSHDETDDDHLGSAESAHDATKSMKMVLDQKNYLEEWNKRLESSLLDLQAKIKNLEEHNSKLEMEAKLSEARIIKLQGTGGRQRSDTPIEVKPPTTVLPGAITDAIKSFIISDNNQPESVNRPDSNNQSTATDNHTNEELASVGMPEENSTLNAVVINSKVAGNQAPAINNDQTSLADLERELSSLKERTCILEASYRGALEKIKALERDLDVQTSMNSDKDTTIKIYEKDIREKQAQVESLRSSLSDAKKLNSDLSEKLNETSAKLKDHTRTIASLQNSVTKWRLENKNIAAQFEDRQAALKSVSAELKGALERVDNLKRSNEKLSEELKWERENGHSCSVTVDAQISQISELKGRIARLENELKDTRPFKEQTDELQRRCQEYEQSLEEIGAQLRESRLEVENLKENSAVFLDSQWMDSKQVKCCALCEQQFSVTRRKHHCRLCGNVFCQACSDNKMELASSAKPVRVCDTCHAFLLAKFVKSSSSSSDVAYT